MSSSFGIAALILGLFFISTFGYGTGPLSRLFGTEKYSVDSKDGGGLKQEVEKVDAAIGTSSMFVVSHILPPEQVRAVYMSSWVAGTPSIRQKLVDLIDTTEINAVVIDVKDNTGLISWNGRIRDTEEFVAELHKKNIYVIARIAVFQDPLYVTKYPEQSVRSKATGGIWKDHKGVPWVDTGSKDMWNYTLEVSKEAYAKGFDEINLDYIRFPTDGKLSDMVFPISGERALTDKVGIVGDFYKFITSELRKEKIPVSGDIFGIVLSTSVDIPVLGQDAHVALQTFDYVAPMVYPSHYANGAFGYTNPAQYPKEVITRAMKDALRIADEVASSTGETSSSVRAKLRPWYQDFDMGATYTKELVRAQIDAGEGLGVMSWMLWDPANKYTLSALKLE